MTTAGVLGYLLGPLVIASAALVLVMLALHAGGRERSRRVFLLLLLSLELWLIFTFFMRMSPDTRTAALWDRAVSFWILALFVTYFHFCYVYTGGGHRWPIVAAYAFLAAAGSFALLTDLVIERMVVAPYGYAPVVGRMGIPILAGSHLLIGAGIFFSLRAYRAAAGSEDRSHFLLLAVAGLLPLIGSAVDGFTDLPPVGVWTNLAFSAICTLAVLKYRLLDIRVTARRGASRLLAGTIVALPYVGAIAMLSTAIRQPVAWWMYAGGVLLFAILLRPLYGSVQELVDRLFYGQRYDHLLALRDFGREASSAAGMREAGSRLTELVRGALQASTALLLQPTADGLALAASSDPQAPRLRIDGPVARWLRKHRAILPARTITADPELRHVPAAERTELDLMGASVLAPIFAPHGALAAVIVLGPKQTGAPYTTEDLHVLDAAGTQAAMALETSRLYADAEKSRRTLEAWLQGVPDAVVIVDGGGVIRFANKAAGERLAVRAGHHWVLERRESPGHARETILGREYEIASAPLVEPDGSSGLICVLRDITERREQKRARAEWERRARITSHLASIGEMAAGIAHEINNPLTAVIGYSGLLDATSLDPEGREAIEQIRNGARRVAAITQRLLTFARQKKPERRAVKLNDIVGSTLELRSYSLRTSNVNVELDLASDLPDTVADAQQMQQVLLNLVVNAEAAMKSAHGGGRLTVRTRRAGDCVQMIVADDGPGIPAGLQERIFDPFFTTKKVGEGSGLGLSICHGIVSEHHGTITVRDAPGGGAEFCVEIPVVAARPAAEPAATEARTRSAAGQSGGRVLVVDDEPAVRRLLEKILSCEGHRVESAADGRAGFERILSGEYDVVLLDVRMPGMSGVDVHERVRRDQPGLERRIVFMTGDVMAAETQDLITRTGARCVTKPFDVPEVLALVRDLVRSRADC